MIMANAVCRSYDLGVRIVLDLCTILMEQNLAEEIMRVVLGRGVV